MLAIPAFNRGDKVRTKAGRQIMTVEASRDHTTYCLWLENGLPHEGTFDTELLELLARARDVSPQVEIVMRMFGSRFSAADDESRARMQDMN